jgi:hypothetical protein
VAGLTQQGLTIRTQPELRELLRRAVREAIPGIDLDEGPEHQIIETLAEELAIAWETLRAVYASRSDAAEGMLLNQVLALTGSRRRAATHSSVRLTVNLNAGITLPAGSLVARTGDPNAIFATREAVTNPSGSAADVDVDAEALDAGPIAAPADTLTVIVTPVTGWNSVTNAGDASEGLPEATDPQARLQRLIDLAGRGKRTVAAIRAAVARVEDVIEVQVYQNESISTVSGRPGKSIEVVVWDGGSAADDDEIAQAIEDTKAEGIQAHGVGESGTAIDDAGAEKTIAFTRASSLRTYVVIEVVLRAGTGAGWEDQVASVVAARGAEYSVGEKAWASQLICAVLDEVPAIEAVTSLTLGTAPAPVGTSVTPTYAQIIRIDADDVTATEAP